MTILMSRSFAEAMIEQKRRIAEDPHVKFNPANKIVMPTPDQLRRWRQAKRNGDNPRFIAE